MDSEPISGHDGRQPHHLQSAVVNPDEDSEVYIKASDEVVVPSLFEQLDAMGPERNTMRREAFIRPQSKEDDIGLVDGLPPTGRTRPLGATSRPTSAQPQPSRPQSSSRRPISTAGSEISALSGSEKASGTAKVASDDSDSDDDDGEDDGPEVSFAPGSRGSSRSSRRAAVDSSFEVELALRKRVKKISVELPPLRSHCRRILQVVFKPKVFQHIIDECVGGVYGKPSRPDLELLEIGFNEDEQDDEAGETVRVLYNSSREAYVHSPLIEDLIIEKLLENDRNLGLVKYSAIITHKGPIITMCPAVKSRWRKFVSIYIVPLLNDKNRVKIALRRLLQYRHKLDPEQALRREIEVYSPEDVDLEASRDQDERNRIRKERERDAKKPGSSATASAAVKSRKLAPRGASQGTQGTAASNTAKHK